MPLLVFAYMVVWLFLLCPVPTDPPAQDEGEICTPYPSTCCVCHRLPGLPAPAAGPEKNLPPSGRRSGSGQLLVGP